MEGLPRALRFTAVAATAVAIGCSLQLNGEWPAPTSNTTEAGARDSGPGADGASCVPERCPGQRCVAGACGFYATCRELHAEVGSALSGPAMLGSPPAAAGWPAYCDMTTDGGGWTLVARSVAGGTGAVSWLLDTGTLNDESTPYSVDVRRAGLSFTQVLVGARGDMVNGWGSIVYRLEVGPALDKAHSAESSIVAITGIRVDPTCTGTPAIFQYAGYADEKDHLFFSAAGARATTGLFGDGWRLSSGDCVTSGKLHGLQGMAMVR